MVDGEGNYRQGSYLDEVFQELSDGEIDDVYLYVASEPGTVGSLDNATLQAAGGLPRVDGKVFPYERLKCYWKLREVRTQMLAAGQAFPPSERYNLTDQLRRASTGMILNLVEGSLRTTGKAQANFTSNAFGSLHEAFECIKLGVDDGHLPKSISTEIRDQVWQLTKMLSALRAYQLRSCTQ